MHALNMLKTKALDNTRKHFEQSRLLGFGSKFYLVLTDDGSFVVFYDFHKNMILLSKYDFPYVRFSKNARGGDIVTSFMSSFIEIMEHHQKHIYLLIIRTPGRELLTFWE